MASSGVRGGMKHGGRSALYGWQSSTSIAEVSGFLPRHAMWGSDGRVKWKERRAHCSLADGKRKMNSVFVHPLSLSRPLSFLFVNIPYALAFLSLLLLILQIEIICRLLVATIPAQSIVDPSPGRLRLLSFLTASTGCETDHQWYQRDWSRLMKSPDASSHHNLLVTSQVLFCPVNMLWHFLYLRGCLCHA